ncbi:MAG: TonB family protein [Gammaproteobacteria bacterium]
MTINYPPNLSRLIINFAVYGPTQIAILAVAFSFLLHLWIWQVWQTAASKTEPVIISHRIEAVLMSPEPEQPPAVIKPKLVPAQPLGIKNTEPKAMPKPVPKSVPLVKPLPKPIRKISKPVVLKPDPPMAKHKTNDTPPGGYGIASQTGHGTGSDIGFGGEAGNDKRGVTGTGTRHGGGGSDTGAYTEANFKANYATNPKPKYPEIATSRGWEGTVLLRVKVTADGRSEEIAVHQSSGHKMLDKSAIIAVQKWRFIPAKRGNTSVACTVIVPIAFTLNN